MRVEQWVGLVTDGSPFSIPEGAATELINMRPRSGRMVTRKGMRRVASAEGLQTQSLLDCYAVEIGGQPVLIAMNDAGELIGMRSPMHVESSPSPISPLTPSSGEIATDYTQNIATSVAGYEVPGTLPGDQPPIVIDINLIISGGKANTSSFSYKVDGNAECVSLPEVEGGTAGFKGPTNVVIEDLCAA